MGRRTPENTNKVEDAIRIMVGSKLKEHFDKTGLTTRELSKRLGLNANSANLLYRYVNGEKNVSVARLIHFLIVLNIDPSEFFSSFSLMEVLDVVSMHSEAVATAQIEMREAGFSFL
jgi:transcriptional regulator with XRE-family HTH domain